MVKFICWDCAKRNHKIEPIHPKGFVVNMPLLIDGQKAILLKFTSSQARRCSECGKFAQYVIKEVKEDLLVEDIGVPDHVLKWILNRFGLRVSKNRLLALKAIVKLYFDGKQTVSYYEVSKLAKGDECYGIYYAIDDLVKVGICERIHGMYKRFSQVQLSKMVVDKLINQLGFERVNSNART